MIRRPAKVMNISPKENLMRRALVVQAIKELKTENDGLQQSQQGNVRAIKELKTETMT